MEKISSSQKNDSSPFPFHFKALKHFFLESASQSGYRSIVLKLKTSVLEIEKILVFGRTQETSSFPQKSIKYFSLRDKPLNFMPFEPP